VITLNGFSEWKQLKTTNKPAAGLINYGMAVTNSGKIVLHGGFTKNEGVFSRTNRNLIEYSDLWFLTISEKQPDFQLVVWSGTTVAGFSRILSLGDENICILNQNIKNQMIVLDTRDFIVKNFDPANIDKVEHSGRIGFGAVSLSNSTMIVIGGFIPDVNGPKEITGSYIFSIQLKENLNSYNNNSTYK
jgi:hypothetical protein